MKVKFCTQCEMMLPEQAFYVRKNAKGKWCPEASCKTCRDTVRIARKTTFLASKGLPPYVPTKKVKDINGRAKTGLPAKPHRIVEPPVKDAVVFQVNMSLPSLANSRNHWTHHHKITKKQRDIITRHWKATMYGYKFTTPLNVMLVRCSPRKLDGDNLTMALKAARDTIADILIPGLAPGRADGDDRITWHYEYEKTSIQSLKVFLWKSWDQSLLSSQSSLVVSLSESG